MAKLLLYTSVGCHLCEQAEALISPLLSAYPLELETVEIADDDALLERYAQRIPVVKLEGAKEDLGWPFDTAALQAYLDS